MQHNILPTKSAKRPHSEIIDDLSQSKTKSVIDRVFELAKEDSSSKPKRAYKKRKQDDKAIPIYESNALTAKDVSHESTQDIIRSFEQLSDFEEESNEDFDQSLSSTSDKKKRVLTKNQRVAANQRERKRMNIMNESFANLRQALPISTGRKRRKMSRLVIVIGAMEYITYLDDLLKTDGPCVINFDAYQNSLYFYD